MLLEAHTGTIIWTLITFAVVLVVLKAAVWKPLLQALDEREQRIRESLAAAEKARAESQANLDEQQRLLEQAHAEARQLVAQAREAAERISHEIVAEARQEAEHTAQAMRRELESERLAALDQLRREVAELAVRAAGMIIDAELDSEKNRKLVDDMIARIPRAPVHN
ncbi:MAG: ATP synthase F0 subunit B [Candidatus Latescibacteria bacterium]|nr:ATP synthase F0 subunit B [Candidatus Latescibacterota bacterium]